MGFSWVGIMGAEMAPFFSSTKVGAVHTSQLVVTQYLGFLHSEVRPQSRNSPLQTRYHLLIWVFPADLGVGFVALQLLIHMICLFKAVLGIQGGCSLFLSSQVSWHGLLPAVPDPKQQMKLFVTWSMKSINVNRGNIFSRILGNAIAIELVIAACGSHSGGILSLTPLYIWSKNAFSLSLCSTR